MQKNIKEQNFNSFRKQDYCDFKINKKIDCIEFGYSRGDFIYKNYTTPAVDSPI